ncbi:MAG: glycosyltransferase family 87 protein [Chthoniobacterales bacterium]
MSAMFRSSWTEVFKKPGFWNTIAWVAWTVALLGLILRFCFGFHRAYAFMDYMLAGFHWMHGEDLYVNWRGFIYSPVAAAFFAPFAWLPPQLAYTLWLLLNVGALLGGLAAILKTTLLPVITKNNSGIVYLLLLPFTLGNLDVGQANPFVIGFLMFAVAAVYVERWNTAALCVAVPTFFKVYPLALGLLICVIAPRRFSWRLLIALLFLAAAPFLFQHWSYVSDQYHAWIATRGADDRRIYPINYVPLDLWFLLHWIAHLPIAPWAYSLIQLSTGAALALFSRWGTWKQWRTERVLNGLFFLTPVWMVLCGPATESHTYLLLVPALVLALVQSINERHPVWMRALVFTAFALQLINHNTRTSYLFHVKQPWIFSAQPISALLFVVYCLFWLLNDSFWPADGFRDSQ